MPNARPKFHLVDEHGCGLNDPNGPFWDPVHGVAHVFYQIHLAEKAVSPYGRGSDWGHWVSRDLVSWASMPVGVWNGLSLDKGVWPPRKTMYDSIAIFSGSALVVDGAGPGGKGAGVVMFYPGLCDSDDWANCTKRDRDHEPVLLATAVPADYANDALLTNWSKPSHNPIWPAINHSGDPSTPWQTASGEWRIRTSDTVLGAASTAGLLAGKWYEIGQHEGFVDSNCPSFFPLPPATPGTEAAYAASRARGPLPTHVQKTSACGIRAGAPRSFHGCFDRWQVGTYDTNVRAGERGAFVATEGWEDMFAHRVLDAVPGTGGKLPNGAYYASKDGEFPAADAHSAAAGATRRLNFGWVLAPAAGQDVASSGAHALPRQITFNARTRALEQAPMAEAVRLRKAPAFNGTVTRLNMAGGAYELPVDGEVARQSELLVTFSLPPVPPLPHASAVTLGVAISGAVPPNGSDAGQGPVLVCTVAWASPNVTATGGHGAGAPQQHEYYEATARCGDTTQPLRLLPGERSVELRAFCDWTFCEVYFQGGRTVMTTPLLLGERTTLSLLRSTEGAGLAGGGEGGAHGVSAEAAMATATVWPMKPIMTTPEAVRSAPRIF
eukprot:g2982.t1